MCRDEGSKRTADSLEIAAGSRTSSSWLWRQGASVAAGLGYESRRGSTAPRCGPCRRWWPRRMVLPEGGSNPLRVGHDVHAPTLTGLGERSHLLSQAIDLDTTSPTSCRCSTTTICAT